jgi:hypothetical protein
MTNSYLGIITRRGLETLVPETGHTALFLTRRVARQPWGEAIACWAVLDEAAMHAVKQQVAGHRFQEALVQLNVRAIHLGTLPPPILDDDLLRSA